MAPLECLCTSAMADFDGCFKENKLVLFAAIFK
jgi:hypothetical protein